MVELPPDPAPPSAKFFRHTEAVEYADDPERYRQLLEAKLRSDIIRATLGFAGLYQIVQEMLKQSVVEEVRNFYRHGFDESGWLYDEQGYEADVSRLAPKKKFRASLLWLVKHQAISLEQADRLDVIYAHRNALTHELIKYIVDPEFDPDVALLVDALTILRAIRRFWTAVEIDIGTFENLDKVDLDEAIPLSVAVLQMSIDAYVDGLPDRDDSEGRPEGVSE